MFKLIKYLILFVIVAALGAAAWLYQFAHAPLRLSSDPVEFTVAPGSSLRGATREIRRAGVDMPGWAFEALVRVVSKPTDIKAGSYELRAGATPLDLLGKLVRGDFALADVKLIEGWTFRQVRAALDAHPRIRHDTAGLSDADVLRRLELPIAHPEGWFFPDTYVFARGASDVEILRQAYRAMEKRLTAAWAQRQPQVPLGSPYDALILASIVEKETGRGDDRLMVAAVLTNRLRSGMKLQADPTVIYGLGARFDGNLRKQDLVTDTPYNTYMREGLPPTPIAMPGLASIEATLRPAESDALYFVARGDGSSEFSRTLEEHNRAVTKYQRGGRP
ncbi:MAG TPA: endolytic transglycosylase MltG [Burkholderiales bacterium]|nr:endolytic transglycosylase MltG [Burkholderiales bacterium]